MEYKELPAVKEQLMKCVRCGKCKSVCPVFSEVGMETVAPRGHVFMAQMLRDNKVKPEQALYDRLAMCLLCETCSVNCPSGIDIHELNAAARAYIYEKNPRLSKELIFDTLWTKPRLLRASTRMMSGMQKLGLQKLARNTGLTGILPGDLKEAEKMLDNIPFHSAKSRLSQVNPAKTEKKYTVGYFLGCGTDVFNPDITLATVDILTRCGCEVIVPTNLKCCGLPHIANGKADTARELAFHNIKIFNSYDVDCIITDCASCASALSYKNMEFLFKGKMIEEEAYQFSSKVMELTSFLINVVDIKLTAEAKTDKPVKVTYHDPCHLVNALGISSEPRELLSRIPGVELVEMKEAASCCGGSGTYSVTHHGVSMKILDRKMEKAMATGAKYLATCCPSCIMQLSYGVKRHNWKAEVLHPVLLLDRYYKKTL